jgi:UDPglucose 6-dehydrogenase
MSVAAKSLKLPRLSVVGLGKLGSPFAATLAAAGFQVRGTDKNKLFVDAINKGKPPVMEPMLAEMIRKSGRNLKATPSIHDSVMNSEMTFIIVPTPSNDVGVFRNDFVIDVMEKIGAALKEKYAQDKKNKHVVVVMSTVMPRASDQVIVPALEKASGLKVGRETV